MRALNVRLLGRLDVRFDDETAVHLRSRNAQHLFAYLLLYRGRSHTREALASLMWPESRSTQARKYLRQTLWQLNKALDAVLPDGHDDVLLTDPEWIQLNPEAGLWLDVAAFEGAWTLVQGTPGGELDSRRRQALERALQLYRGDLLEGCYEDWCVFERERLQGVYVGLLEKRMITCEVHGDYEHGLDCGVRALQCDVAHERIHRRMMRLRYLAGDRTGALRQYQRCVAFLRDELGVKPSPRTAFLYERIRSGHPLVRAGTRPPAPRTRDQQPPSAAAALEHLEQLEAAFVRLQGQLQETIDAFRTTVRQED
jgi:DNA-binding SARP family transcriptional activator